MVETPAAPFITFDSRKKLPMYANLTLRLIPDKLELIVITNSAQTKLRRGNTRTFDLGKLETEPRWLSFRDKYVHLSPNEHQYELSCFQRYFAYLIVMRELSLRESWVIDTDVAVFGSIRSWEKPRQPVLSSRNPDDAVSSHCGFFTIEDMESLVAFLEEDFYAQSNLEKLKVIYAQKVESGTGGVNDMTAIAQWLRTPGKVEAWTNAENKTDKPLIGHIFNDLNLGAFPRSKVTISQEALEVHQPGLQTKSFAAVHFQGGDKFMPIALQVLSGRLVRRSTWVALGVLSQKFSSLAQVKSRVVAAIGTYFRRSK